MLWHRRVLTTQHPLAACSHRLLLFPKAAAFYPSPLQLIADAVKKVFDRDLRDSVHQGAICNLAEEPKRRLITGAQAELGSGLANWRDFKLSVQTGEESSVAGRSPTDREQCYPAHRAQRTKLNLNSPGHPALPDIEPQLSEQPLALSVRLPSKRGHPLLGACREVGLNLLDLSLIHISEPTRLGMISYAVFCLKKK